MAARKSYRRRNLRKSKKSRKSSRRSQRGGSSCAMMPLNRPTVAQVGGMAPIVQGDDYLLNAATRVQAEVGPLDKAFGELPMVIPKMSGGRRYRKTKKSKKSKKSRKGSRRARRSQRGGAELAAFDQPELLLRANQYAMDGTNPQFRTEGSVNPGYKGF
jgi:hypothetical protein